MNSESIAVVERQEEDEPLLKIINLAQRTASTYSLKREDGKKIAANKWLSMVVAADDVNYYLFEKSDNRMIFPSVSGSEMVQVQNEIVAISRSTGKVAWVCPVEEGTLACFEGSEDVLMLIHTATTDPKNARPQIPNLPRGIVIPGFMNQTGQKHSVEGVARITGHRRFLYDVVAQRPFPELALARNAANHLELEAFGNRVRFVPETVTPPVVAP